MISDGERSDEDSRMDESTANGTNGDTKPEIAQTAKVNGGGNPADDGDESSVASTSKDVKESKDRENTGKSKTKKKALNSFPVKILLDHLHHITILDHVKICRFAISVS